MYKVTNFCEPQLGKHGLYPTVSKYASPSQKGQYDESKAILDFVAYADGTNDLISLSDITNVSVELLDGIAKKLLSSGLIEVI